MPRVDPFTVEIIRNALDSISEQMASVVERTAYSSIIRYTHIGEGAYAETERVIKGLLAEK